MDKQSFSIEAKIVAFFALVAFDVVALLDALAVTAW